jgi:hypothetical protein
MERKSMDGNDLLNCELLRSSLISLRSKFEAGALKFQNVRLSICRESFEPYVMPVFAASQQADNNFRNGLRPLIGHDVDGMLRIRSESFADGANFYHWWLIHDELRSINLRSPSFFIDDLHDEAEKTAEQCLSLLDELTEEAGRLLRNFAQVGCGRVEALLEMPYQRFGRILWLVALVELARDASLGTALRVTRTIPREIGLDIYDCSVSEEIPNSVIANLDSNPFSASVTFVDLLIASLTRPKPEPPEPDGPCGAFQWRHNGNVLPHAMAPGPWKLANFLWGEDPRQAAFDGLLVPVYDDPNHVADRVAFGSLRREANKFFRLNQVPYRLKLRKTLVCMVRVEESLSGK